MTSRRTRVGPDGTVDYRYTDAAVLGKSDTCRRYLLERARTDPVHRRRRLVRGAPAAPHPRQKVTA
ncbi:hypothetical protein Afe04nite_53370 [Asanoa ferruginea]|nr:hypothetical protein Afe04nite_53370 [Asanoa ferruginea]